MIVAKLHRSLITPGSSREDNSCGDSSRGDVALHVDADG
jgi:hypothetical protein